MIKEHKLVVFTIPPYSPELNKIENTFGRLKNRISFQNLNSKDFKACDYRRNKKFIVM